VSVHFAGRIAAWVEAAGQVPDARVGGAWLSSGEDQR
jgi:hypothetical protein